MGQFALREEPAAQDEHQQQDLFQGPDPLVRTQGEGDPDLKANLEYRGVHYSFRIAIMFDFVFVFVNVCACVRVRARACVSQSSCVCLFARRRCFRFGVFTRCTC